MYTDQRQTNLACLLRGASGVWCLVAGAAGLLVLVLLVLVLLVLVLVLVLWWCCCCRLHPPEVRAGGGRTIFQDIFERTNHILAITGQCHRGNSCLASDFTGYILYWCRTAHGPGV